eukprot:7486130-Pyramimonas_sp.AAC.1
MSHVMWVPSSSHSASSERSSPLRMPDVAGCWDICSDVWNRRGTRRGRSLSRRIVERKCC